MRLSDYVIRTLEERGIGHAFTVVGGGSIFLCDALAKAERMRYVSCHHEQAAAMAAEAYARVRTGMGVALVTSGPGGTNAITGVAGAWMDHVPTLTLSGQVFLNQTITGHPGLRSLGVQEINIVDLVKPITKYSAVVRTPQSIRYHLERALHAAQSGRPGPVWLDIPADMQKAEIDPMQLEGYDPEPLAMPRAAAWSAVRDLVDLLKSARRPLIHVGQGVRLAGGLQAFEDLIERLRIPVVTARNANDVMDSGHELYIGRPGTFAQRGANFAVQTCDLYLAIGTRLSLAQTGYNAKDYAREAKVVMVDIDRAELDKGTVPVYLKVQADALEFMSALLTELEGVALPDWSPWLERCKEWQAKYPPVLPEQRAQEKFVNSYHLVEELSKQLTPSDVVVTDMGFAFQNTHQAFAVKAGQRVFTNCGLAAMGWGLPAAIGAAVGSGRRVTCITGDGGLMMNAQELSTVKHHGLPIKIFVLNNDGYLTMRQSQENAFDRYMGSDGASGLSFPDFKTLARAHGIQPRFVERSSMLQEVVTDTLAEPGPALCEVLMDPKQAQIPKSVNKRDAAGNIKQTALEDSHPYLRPEWIKAELALGTGDGVELKVDVVLDVGGAR